MNRTAFVFVVLLSSGGLSAQTGAQRALDRGAVLYKEGRFDEAAKAFEEAAELDPGSLEVWESLGWSYRKGGRADEAKEVWTRILKVDPERVSLWNQVAAIDIEREDWAAAEFTYQPSFWDKKHRFIAIRHRLQQDSHLSSLFQNDGHDFRVLVTNLDLEPEADWRFYACRPASNFRTPSSWSRPSCQRSNL